MRDTRIPGPPCSPSTGQIEAQRRGCAVGWAKGYFGGFGTHLSPTFRCRSPWSCSSRRCWISFSF